MKSYTPWLGKAKYSDFNGMPCFSMIINGTRFCRPRLKLQCFSFPQCKSKPTSPSTRKQGFQKGQCRWILDAPLMIPSNGDFSQVSWVPWNPDSTCLPCGLLRWIRHSRARQVWWLVVVPTTQTHPPKSQDKDRIAVLLLVGSEILHQWSLVVHPTIYERVFYISGFLVADFWSVNKC